MTTTLTDQRAAFMAVIIAAPEDDTPRLIFADWLEEQGESDRAEFIRVQCELVKGMQCHAAPTPCHRCPDCAAYFLAAACEERLLDSHWLAWLGIIHEVIPVGAEDFQRYATFRRGFVEEITCSGETWRRHAAALMAATPLRRVRLTTWPSIVRHPDHGDYSFWYNFPGRENTICVSDIEPIDSMEIARRLLKKEWPDIEFTLLED